MSIRLNELPPKVGKITNSTKLATEDPNDETNKTRMIPAGDIVPAVYALSDEDSPLSSGILYTTEANAVARSIKDVIISVKNAPSGSDIEVDTLKETGVNTDIFNTIFSVKPIIMVGEFTSETALPVPIISDDTWEKGRRLQFVLTINDSSFIASGLKAAIKS